MESTEEPVEEPTEEPTEEPAAELSDAQKAALENLPAGFSAGTVALAMMQSSGCEHTNLWVDENSNESQYSSINDEKHLRTYTVKSRTLECVDCGKALQTIAVNETITVERRHVWNIKSVGKKITIECSYCQKTKTISKPCSHNSFAMSEDGNLHCTQCSKQSVLNPEQTYCKHTNYTEYGTKASPLVEYQAYSKEQHVKHSETWVFSNGLGFATCDDCGIWLGLKNGKVNSVGITDFDAEDDKIESALEAHTFENGACKFCGETAPKGCDHSAGNFRDEQDKSIAPKYDNITETTHCVQYSYKRYCKDCGEYIQNVLDEGVTPVAHDFSKGNTCACGYQKQAEMKPYVRGFKMSATSVKVDGDTVRFTLDIANIKDGETVKLQFRADEWTEDFNLTAPNNVFEHKFSRAGNRQIQFRVADGEWCPAQTLKVIAEAAEVKTIRLSSTYIKEQKEGETITATVTCNNATGLVDLYVNSEYVALSSTYTEENGNRVFAISFKLGGNGKYAGEYKIRAAALKEAYASEWDNSDIVTLTVKHNYEVSGETKYEDYWEKSADGHTRYRKATMHFVCQVCNAKDERSDKYAIGSLQSHDSDLEECKVCGYKKINPPQDDPSMSDAYKNSEFYQKLKEVNLTGNYEEDIVNVARSQIGYTETGNNNTAYGAFTKQNKESWCASFVSWCASKAGLSDVFKIGTYANPDYVLKSGYSVWYFAEYPSWRSVSAAPGKGFHYFMAGAGMKEYDSGRNIVIPQKGDLIFFATVKGEAWAHVGIVEDYDSATQTITYIDGNGTNEGTEDYKAELVDGQTGNKTVSRWRIGLKNENICAIARPNY